VVGEDFNERLDQVERAIKVISTIENNPDLQAAAFNHLFGTAPSLRGDAYEEPLAVNDPPPGAETDDTSKSGNGSNRAPRQPAAVPQDKTLNISPTGKISWADFAAEKKPAGMNDKYAVCVYWLVDIAELPKATVNQIVSLFIAAKWTLP